MQEFIPMRIQLVSNPDSGSYSAPLIAKLTAELERQGATVLPGESSPRQALIIDPTAERLIVVGGDGTLRHVVAAVQASGRQIPVVPYPGGTVNLMQLEIRQPTDIARFVRLAMGQSEARTQHPVTINDTAFLVCASIGPDSEAVANVSVQVKRWLGKLAYVFAFISVLVRWPRHALTLTVDNEPLNCEAFYLAKGRFFAGPWSFAPAARVDEQALHLVTITHLSRWIYTRFMLAMLLGRPVQSIPGVHHQICRHLVVHADAAVPIQGDGDIVSTTPAHIALGKPYLVLRH